MSGNKLLLAFALLLQSGLSLAESSDVFIWVFDETPWEMSDSPRKLTDNQWQELALSFKLPVDEALKSASAGFITSHGLAFAPPDAQGLRAVEYLTLSVRMTDTVNGIRIIKQKLIDLGADAGSRVKISSSSGTTQITLIGGEWTLNEDLDFEFEAEILVEESDIIGALEVLRSSNLFLQNEGFILQKTERLPANHSFIFDAELKRHSRARPVQIALQKAEDMTVSFSVLSSDKHLVNLVQAAFDSFEDGF